jgi:biotin operon repressor
VAIALLRDPTATGAALAERLGVSRSTISAAASTLAEAGMLDRTDGYELVQPETTLTLLVRYADSFDDETVALADDAASIITHDP